MKFLCVPCDRPMELAETAPPDRGSIRLTYSCPDCGYEFAMMTNPFETEVVSSMGVKIGADEPGDAAEAGASKCPFSAMVQDMTAPSASTEPGGYRWTDEAEQRLENMPDFVRPMARSGIEKFARERGYEFVDGAVLDEARQFFGM